MLALSACGTIVPPRPSPLPVSAFSLRGSDLELVLVNGNEPNRAIITAPFREALHCNHAELKLK
jgi:hypothetical protein